MFFNLYERCHNSPVTHKQNTEMMYSSIHLINDHLSTIAILEIKSNETNEAEWVSSRRHDGKVNSILNLIIDLCSVSYWSPGKTLKDLMCTSLWGSVLQGKPTPLSLNKDYIHFMCKMILGNHSLVSIKAARMQVENFSPLFGLVAVVPYFVS